jgi:hemolysin activation/secretion protein
MVLWKRLIFGCIVAAAAATGGLGQSTATVPAHYHFRHVILASTAALAKETRVTANGAKLAIIRVPILDAKDFPEVINPYIGKEIDQTTLSQMVADVTDYLHRHGQNLVNISLPEQSVSEGVVRLVVVVGAYDLKRLVLGSTFEGTRDLKIGPGAGQIVLDRLPELQKQEFAVALARAFGQPITDESLDDLVNVIGAFAKTQGLTLAKVALPPQNIRTGELRIALTMGVFPLRRIELADSAAAAARLHGADPGASIVAPRMPYFRTRPFAEVMERYFGQPISIDLVERLKKDVAAYVATQDRIVSQIPPPEVDTANGEIRMTVLLEHYSQIHFKGNRWFSDRLLARQFGVKPGDEVRVSQINAAVNQLNQNPFRHAQVLLDTVNKDPGVADVDVAIQEATPYKAGFSYDNTGNDTLGNNHYTVTAQAGNLFGLDQQLSYQYTTTDVTHAFHSNVLTYRAPLPWRHYLTVTGAFSGYRSDFAQNIFHLKGRNYQGDVRYVIPIIRDQWSVEYSVGVDYKQNYLAESYASQPVLQNAQDVAQATSSLTWIKRDKLGSFVVSLNGNLSPGHFNNRNSDAAFRGNVLIDPTDNTPIGGPEAQARYVYGNGFIQRMTTLPGDFQIIARAQGQMSSARLVGSERFSIGGAATIRGYNERIESGDEGWAFTTELRGPAWHQHIPYTPARFVPLESRLLLFYDDGRTNYRHPRIDDFPLSRLSSTGVGLRSNWGSNFSLSADYGWQISSTGEGVFAQHRHGKFHLQGALTF